MGNDTGLQRDVTDELKRDLVTRDAEIAVTVTGGVVTLRGTVDSYAKKLAAECVAERVSGVRVVADDLHVALPSAHQRPDAELAHATLEALRRDAALPAGRVGVRVSDGWVTLEGDVDRDSQRRAAVRAVRDLTGVRGVTTLVAARPTVSASEVSRHLRDALRQHPGEDLRGIEVEAVDGTVVLRGTVRSWAEKWDAGEAVWAASGVTRVEDCLIVQA